MCLLFSQLGAAFVAKLCVHCCFDTTVNVITFTVYMVWKLCVSLANEAKPDISTSKPDTYVIIDGVRKRVTDDVSARRHQQADAMAGDHLARTTIPPTYGEGMHEFKIENHN